MPLILPAGCHHRTERDATGIFHHITTSHGETFVAREMRDEREWWGWTDLDAMRVGVNRLFRTTPTLSDMIADLDRLSTPAKLAA